MANTTFVQLSSGHIINTASIRWIWKTETLGYFVFWNNSDEKLELNKKQGRELLAALNIKSAKTKVKRK